MAGLSLADIPVIGGAFDNSSDQALSQYQNALNALKGVNLPDFQKYAPLLEQYMGNYDPSQAQASTIQENPDDRSTQLAALNKLSGLSNTGLSDVDNAGYENARNIGNQMLSSGNAAAIQNAQARGVGGSGLEFAMREMANQQGAQNAQQAGLQQAGQSAQMRALYNQAFGNMAGQVRGQDFNTAASNAGILNNFNMYNTGQANQAQLRNQNEMQGISNQNVGQQNYAQQYNNNLQQQQYQDAMGKAQAESGAYGNVAKGYYGNQAQNDNTRGAITQGLGAVAGYAAGSPGAGAAEQQHIAGQNQALENAPDGEVDLSQYMG